MLSEYVLPVSHKFLYHQYYSDDTPQVHFHCTKYRHHEALKVSSNPLHEAIIFELEQLELEHINVAINDVNKYCKEWLCICFCKFSWIFNRHWSVRMWSGSQSVEFDHVLQSVAFVRGFGYVLEFHCSVSARRTLPDVSNSDSNESIWKMHLLNLLYRFFY